MNHNLPAHEFEVGHIFEGKYKILRELGRGGFGMVYLGYQQSMDRHVALKVLKGGAAGEQAGARERFLREVKIIAKLKHPNTVTIHESGETHDGALYMVLEFVEGEELKQIFSREGAQDPLRACNIARQIAKSLSEAHRHGVVHRDLKPANIMLTQIEGEEDFVKVLDFGVARLLDPKTADLTSVGLPEGERELIGTPRYMSPEQVRGESLTGSSDIYSLGLILYEALSGEPAVQGDTTMALITQQISPEPLRLWGLENHDPLIQDIVRIATSKGLSDRFQTAEQMGEALEQAIFNIRRARNMTGSGAGSGDFGTPFQTGAGQFHDPTGFHPSGSWDRPPSGNYGFGAGNPQQGLDPRSSGHWQGQSGVQQGFDPRQTGHGSGQQPQQQQHQPAFNPRATGPQFGFGQGPQNSGHQQQSGFRPQQSSGNYPEQSRAPSIGPGDSGPGIDIDLDIDEFQPTVERNALSRDSLPSFSELPPVQDENPFASQEVPVAEPRATEANRAVAPPEDDDLVEFSIDMVKILVLGLTAVIGVYASFIMIGAAMVEILDDTFLRLVATSILCAGIPLFTALGENSQKERFRVLEKPRTRLIRILIGTTIFSMATGMLVSIALASTVTRELRTDPNWFISAETEKKTDAGLRELNREMSYMAADAAGWTADALGLYDDPGRVEAGPIVPAPTRNRGPASTDELGGEDQPTSEETDVETPSGAASEPSPARGDDAPSPGPEPEDDDYVRW